MNLGAKELFNKRKILKYGFPGIFPGQPTRNVLLVGVKRLPKQAYQFRFFYQGGVGEVYQHKERKPKKQGKGAEQEGFPQQNAEDALHQRVADMAVHPAHDQAYRRVPGGRGSVAIIGEKGYARPGDNGSD